ncbi:MAG: MAE_28990/MAE_18760 family HEPN-like nuclease [Lachnospiraceae bacterium]|nr:MAE_28990/MAE_18760 family HEPN-like nuclease [Lachnospiraceae bacterium]
MITFKDTYDMRKKEIEEFIELMEFLEAKEYSREDGISEFSKFFYEGKLRIHLTFQSLINILKSNVSLMIYNIIEYTVSNLIDSIYDEIRINHLSYIDVNESIRALWRKAILKAANDPKANFNTFLRKNEEIIDGILNNSIIEMHSRNTLPAGNLDGKTIKETFELHGIQVKTSSRYYRPDILEGIKESRNNLAHGSVSFVDAVRTDSIEDIKHNEEFAVAFLEELIETVETYLSQQNFKQVL